MRLTMLFILRDHLCSDVTFEREASGYKQQLPRRPARKTGLVRYKRQLPKAELARPANERGSLVLRFRATILEALFFSMHSSPISKTTIGKVGRSHFLVSILKPCT